jgi:hypothetical protein
MVQGQPGRQEDWVVFQLKATAPDYVALGRTRFAGSYRRDAEPFKCTRGEWLVFLEKTGFFEQVKSQELKVEAAFRPPVAG